MIATSSAGPTYLVTASAGLTFRMVACVTCASLLAPAPGTGRTRPAVGGFPVTFHAGAQRPGPEHRLDAGLALASALSSAARLRDAPATVFGAQLTVALSGATALGEAHMLAAARQSRATVAALID